HHSCDEAVRVCQFQQPSRLGDAVACLNQDGSVCLDDRSEIVWEVVAIEDAQIARHPRVIETTYLPEVLVAIDHVTRIRRIPSRIYADTSRGFSARLPSWLCLGSLSHSSANVVTSSGARLGRPTRRIRKSSCSNLTGVLLPCIVTALTLF